MLKFNICVFRGGNKWGVWIVLLGNLVSFGIYFLMNIFLGFNFEDCVVGLYNCIVWMLVMLVCICIWG